MTLPVEIHLPFNDGTVTWKKLVEFVTLGKQIGVQDDDEILTSYDDHDRLLGLSVVGDSDGIDTNGL